MDISSWMIDQITVASPTGAVDNYGQTVYDTPRTVNCRLEKIRKLIVNPDGNEVEARHKIATDTAITWEDRIWLPGESSTSDASKRPLSVTSANTKFGDYTIYEVIL